MLWGGKQAGWGLGRPAARSPQRRCLQRTERIPWHSQPHSSHHRTAERGEAEGCSRTPCAGVILQPPSTTISVGKGSLGKESSAPAPTAQEQRSSLASLVINNSALVCGEQTVYRHLAFS